MMEDVENDSLVDSENVNMEYNINVVEDQIVGGDVAIVLKVGIKFKDKNEAFNFYKLYAYNIGFLLR